MQKHLYATKVFNFELYICTLARIKPITANAERYTTICHCYQYGVPMNESRFCFSEMFLADTPKSAVNNTTHCYLCQHQICIIR